MAYDLYEEEGEIGDEWVLNSFRNLPIQELIEFWTIVSWLWYFRIDSLW